MECIEHPRKYFFCFFFPSSFLLSIPSPLPVFFSIYHVLSIEICFRVFSVNKRSNSMENTVLETAEKSSDLRFILSDDRCPPLFLLSPPRFVSIKLLPLLQQSDNSLTYQEKYHSRNETKTREIDKREEAYF